MSDERLSYKLDFHDKKKIKNLNKKKKAVLVCGDYNIAHNELI